jgi:hypothetical protein
LLHTQAHVKLVAGEHGKRWPTVAQLHEMAVAFATQAPEDPVNLDQYRLVVSQLVTLAYTTIRAEAA